jgi:hypothetical protein
VSTRRIAPFAALTAALALPLSLAIASPAAAATVTVETWVELTDAAAVTTNVVVLGADITAPSAGDRLVISAATDITIDLNGYTLSITDPGVLGAAVHVPVGATLTINATGGGTLNATAGGSGAGIGGDYEGSAGTVTINGGTIAATGQGGGAGIGGGEDGNGGTVTVNAGTVTATGSFDGAGIGGGQFGNGGIVTVNGGTISAVGGAFAAGIGGGLGGNGATVTIYGGVVTATGGRESAGIGGGALGAGGTLEIHGTPDAGNATDGRTGGGPNAGVGAPIANPTTPAGVGYSAVTSLVGTGGIEGGSIVVIFNYLVTFDAAGGTSIDDQTVDEGGTIPEPADPNRTEYEFAGWRVGGNLYDFNTPVTDPVALTATWTRVLAVSGAEQGLFLPVALALFLLGGTLLTVGRTRRS